MSPNSRPAHKKCPGGSCCASATTSRRTRRGASVTRGIHTNRAAHRVGAFHAPQHSPKDRLPSPTAQLSVDAGPKRNRTWGERCTMARSWAYHCPIEVSITLSFLGATRNRSSAAVHGVPSSIERRPGPSNHVRDRHCLPSAQTHLNGRPKHGQAASRTRGG